MQFKAWTVLVVLSSCAAACSGQSGSRGTFADGGGQGGGGGSPGVGGGSSAGLLPFLPDASAITMAFDSAGAIHVAASAKVNGTDTLVYAKCSGQCDVAASWMTVALTHASGTNPPTIALTADGRPRIAYDVALGNAPGIYYAACDSGCDNGANWSALQIAPETTPNPTPPARLPFAVSPNGAAVFGYNDGFGGFVQYCQSACTQPASWAKLQVGDAYNFPIGFAFGGDERPQFVTRQMVQDDVRLSWVSCQGDCTQPASWSGLDGLWVTHGSSNIDAVIARTAQGAPRILIYADDPMFRVFVTPDGSFQPRTNPANWSMGGTPLASDAASHGMDLAIDTDGRPMIAVQGDSTLGTTRCTGDCASASGWAPLTGIDTTLLYQTAPFDIPNDCTNAYWGMQTGPSLAPAPGGKFAFAFTGSQRASGGNCGPDVFVASQAFLSLP